MLYMVFLLLISQIATRVLRATLLGIPLAQIWFLFLHIHGKYARKIVNFFLFDINP